MSRSESDDRESVEDDGKPREEEPIDDHLEDIPDGSGCTEIWEHLSKERDGGTDDEE